MGLMNALDNILTFLLRNDKKAGERYAENHPEIKRKKKELKKAIKDANDAWDKVDFDKLK